MFEEIENHVVKIASIKKFLGESGHTETLRILDEMFKTPSLPSCDLLKLFQTKCLNTKCKTNAIPYNQLGCASDIQSMTESLKRRLKILRHDENSLRIAIVRKCPSDKMRKNSCPTVPKCVFKRSDKSEKYLGT